VAAVQCILFSSDFFFLTITATATEDRGVGVISSRKAHPGHDVLIAVLDAPSLALALALLLPLSPLLFPSQTVTVANAIFSSAAPFS
jgi:hypothetical protein